MYITNRITEETNNLYKIRDMLNYFCPYCINIMELYNFNELITHARNICQSRPLCCPLCNIHGIDSNAYYNSNDIIDHMINHHNVNIINIKDIIITSDVIKENHCKPILFHNDENGITFCLYSSIQLKCNSYNDKVDNIEVSFESYLFAIDYYCGKVTIKIENDNINSILSLSKIFRPLYIYNHQIDNSNQSYKSNNNILYHNIDRLFHFKCEPSDIITFIVGNNIIE